MKINSFISSNTNFLWRLELSLASMLISTSHIPNEVINRRFQTSINHQSAEKDLECLNITFNNISVISFMAHRCAGGLKKVVLRSGSQCHRHFVDFFKVSVQHRHLAILSVLPRLDSSMGQLDSNSQPKDGPYAVSLENGQRTYNDKAYTSPQLFGHVFNFRIFISFFIPISSLYILSKKCPNEHKNLDYWYLLCKYGPDT